MASYGGATIHGDLLRGTVAEAKTLTVDRLKKVLRNEGLASGGLKNELQMRVIARLDLPAYLILITHSHYYRFGEHRATERLWRLAKDEGQY